MDLYDYPVTWVILGALVLFAFWKFTARKTCPECGSSISRDARRCPKCTAEIG
jgi:predicted amidophosphoribosyltransferase